MKLADPNPAYCSCCFQQMPTKVHIDFEVAWDGPVINEDGLRVPIDDLYLCQDCIEQAYATYRLAMGYKPIDRLKDNRKFANNAL
jgi:hypothetical protein